MLLQRQRLANSLIDATFGSKNSALEEGAALSMMHALQLVVSQRYIRRPKNEAKRERHRSASVVNITNHHVTSSGRNDGTGAELEVVDGIPLLFHMGSVKF